MSNESEKDKVKHKRWHNKTPIIDIINKTLDIPSSESGITWLTKEEDSPYLSLFTTTAPTTTISTTTTTTTTTTDNSYNTTLRDGIDGSRGSGTHFKIQFIGINWLSFCKYYRTSQKQLWLINSRIKEKFQPSKCRIVKKDPNSPPLWIDVNITTVEEYGLDLSKVHSSDFDCFKTFAPWWTNFGRDPPVATIKHRGGGSGGRGHGRSGTSGSTNSKDESGQSLKRNIISSDGPSQGPLSSPPSPSSKSARTEVTNDGWVLPFYGVFPSPNNTTTTTTTSPIPFSSQFCAPSTTPILFTQMSFLLPSAHHSPSMVLPDPLLYLVHHNDTFNNSIPASLPILRGGGEGMTNSIATETEVIATAATTSKAMESVLFLSPPLATTLPTPPPKTSTNFPSIPPTIPPPVPITPTPTTTVPLYSLDDKSCTAPFPLLPISPPLLLSSTLVPSPQHQLHHQYLSPLPPPPPIHSHSTLPSPPNSSPSYSPSPFPLESFNTPLDWSVNSSFFASPSSTPSQSDLGGEGEGEGGEGGEGEGEGVGGGGEGEGGGEGGEGGEGGGEGGEREGEGGGDVDGSFNEIWTSFL